MPHADIVDHGTKRKTPAFSPLFQTPAQVAAAHVRRSDPASAQDAARRIVARIGPQCQKLLEILGSGLPVPCGEVFRRCAELDIRNLTARVSDLRHKGYTITVTETHYQLTGRPTP